MSGRAGEGAQGGETSSPARDAAVVRDPMLERDERLRALVVRRLEGFAVQTASGGEERAAAVAVAIADEGFGAQLNGIANPVAWSSRAALILTRRAGGLRRHSGQWALPGGRIDQGESAEQAALRELHEEIGLRLGPEAVLGRLDDYVTRSGYVITPIVVWAGAAREIEPNPDEVASVHRIPVVEFLRHPRRDETKHDFVASLATAAPRDGLPFRVKRWIGRGMARARRGSARGAAG